MKQIKILDLQFQGAKQTIASFLVVGSEGPVLVETGPESTWPRLKQEIARHGFKPEDIKQVLLTHIHFDHAGAAWKLAEYGADIYVHPLGLPHLADPSKLWDSAERIYGDAMEKLWGKMAPISQSQLHPCRDEAVLEFGDLKFKAMYTPGHAVHHIAWAYEGSFFTGDVGGVKIGNGPVVPPCPPPDIHLENWRKSIQKILEAKPEALYLTHFGKIDKPAAHLQSLEIIMEDWALWIKKHFDLQTPVEDVIPQFMAYTELQMRNEGVDPELSALYEYANPSWMSVNGLMRYWKLKEQGRI
ncbi:MAG: MBL fold metallo-hydrolase [Cyclobacteriaceae bacterium]